MGCVIGSEPVLLVPDKYSGTCISYEVAPSFRGSTKLKFAFKIDYKDEPVIEAYFNVRKSDTNELFTIGYHSDLYRNTVRLSKKPREVKDFSDKDFINFYLNNEFILIVETITTDSNNRSLSKDTQYSKVGFIESFKEEGVLAHSW